MQKIRDCHFLAGEHSVPTSRVCCSQILRMQHHVQAVQNNGSLYLHTVFEATVIDKTEDDPIGTPRTLEWIRTWRE